MRRSSVRVRRSLVGVRRSSVRVRRSSIRGRRSSIGSAACCKAGPSSILVSEPHGGSSLAERRSDEESRRQASANGEGLMNV